MQSNYWGEHIFHLPRSASLARLLGLRALSRSHVVPLSSRTELRIWERRSVFFLQGHGRRQRILDFQTLEKSFFFAFCFFLVFFFFPPPPPPLKEDKYK